MEKERRQERSIPVQSRVDIKVLAELDAYWKSEGVEMKSMSQLVAWSAELCREILKSNGQLPVEYESAGECHRHLEERGLYQRGLKSRSMAKISAAVRMDSLRERGYNLKEFCKTNYNVLHNKNSVKPYEDRWLGRVESGHREVISQEEWEEIQREIAEEKLEKLKKETLERARQSGMMVESRDGDKDGDKEDPFWQVNSIPERDREIIERENAPLDMEFLKSRIVKKKKEKGND